MGGRLTDVSSAIGARARGIGGTKSAHSGYRFRTGVVFLLLLLKGRMREALPVKALRRTNAAMTKGGL